MRRHLRICLLHIQISCNTRETVCNKTAQRSSGRTQPEMSGIPINLTITGIKETRGNYATGKKEKERRHSQGGEGGKQYGRTDE